MDPMWAPHHVTSTLTDWGLARGYSATHTILQVLEHFDPHILLQSLIVPKTGLIVGKSSDNLRERHWFRYLGLVERLLKVKHISSRRHSTQLLPEHALPVPGLEDEDLPQRNLGPGRPGGVPVWAGV